MSNFTLPIDYEQLTSDYSSRSGATVDMFIWHHAATTSLDAILALFQPGGRTVSATLAIGNDGTTVGCVPERYRPWTSGDAYFDGRAYTAEVANLSVDGWTISDASYDAMGRIAAQAYRNGVPLDRDHHVGHRELNERWGGSYPTACPGGMNVDWIVELGRRNLSGTAGGGVTPIKTDRKEYDMRVYANIEVEQAWRAGSEAKGEWRAIPAAEPWLKAAGQTEPIRLTQAEWVAMEAFYKSGDGDTRVYAPIEGGAWRVVGPGVDYAIQSGEQAIFERTFGSRLPIPRAELDKLRVALNPAPAVSA